MGLRRLWLAGLVGLLVLQGVAHSQENNNNEAEGETEPPPPPSSTRPPLTGNPQIDYKYDPNLPHELIGYDLSDYPFYNKLPKDLLDPSFNFSCEERHDGFYASIPHKCQVYHNCLFNQRYDFLCANYTVFDQKNFICHYVSEVDCENSWKHYDRNNDLYETTTTTTTTTPAPQIIYVERPPPLNGPGRLRATRRPFKRPNKQGGRRRTTTTTTPPPDYYDDYYYDDYYYNDYNDYYYDDEKTTTTTTTTTTARPPRRRPGRPRPGGRPGGRLRGRPGGRPRLGGPGDGTNPRRGSRIQGNRGGPQGGPGGRRRPNRPRGSGPRRKPTTTTTTTTTTTEAAHDDYYYYDDYYDYHNEEPHSSTTTTTTTTSAPAPRRSRPNRVRGGARPQSVEDQATAATELDRVPPVANEQRNTGAPRVSIRRKPLDSSSGPKFPPIRVGAIAGDEIREAAPLNKQDPAAPTPGASERETTGVRSRVRMPRPRKTTTAPPVVDYDYY